MKERNWSLQLFTGSSGRDGLYRMHGKSKRREACRKGEEVLRVADQMRRAEEQKRSEQPTVG